MKYRVLFLSLLLAAVLTAFPAFASAATVVDSGTFGTNLTWSLDSDGTLTVSGNGKIPNNYYSDWPWKDHIPSIQRLELSSGITEIGYRAFYNHSALEEVIFPDTLENIRSQAFQSCGMLRSIHFPSALNSIEDGAFQYCYGLRSVTFPRYITTLGSTAFDECYNLKSVGYMSSKADWNESWNKFRSYAENNFSKGYLVHYNACSSGHTFGTYYPDMTDRYGPTQTAVCIKCDATNTTSRDSYDGYTFVVWSDGGNTTAAIINSWGDFERTGTANNGHTFTLEHIKDNQYYLRVKGSYYVRAISGAPASNYDTYNGKYYLGTTTSKSSATIWTIKDNHFCTTISGTEYMIYSIMNYFPPKGYYDFRLTTNPGNYASYVISVSSTLKTPPHKHTEGTAVREEVIEATWLTDGSYDEVIRCTECGQVMSRKEVTVPAMGPAAMDGMDAAYDESTGTVTLEQVPEGLTLILAAYNGEQTVFAAMPEAENGTAVIPFPDSLSFDSLRFFLLTKDTAVPVAPSRSVPLS